MPFDYQRLEVGARSIERGGVARTSRAQNDNVANIHSGQSDRFSKNNLDAEAKTYSTGSSWRHLPWRSSPNPGEPVPAGPSGARPARPDSDSLWRKRPGK